jgi:hypothetical protein
MMNYKLYAPKEYWDASDEEREANCNGCGSELDLSGTLVPNTMYGLNVIQACCIHDWMYAKGQTLADKLFADCMFLFNLVIIILNSSGLLLKIPRLLRATKYFIAVVRYGETSFFDNKEKNEATYITFKGEFR